MDSLHPAYLGVLFLALCTGSGAFACSRLRLPAVFVLPLGFACVALSGFLAFFAWWWSPEIGRAFSLATGLGGIALFSTLIATPGSILRTDARKVWTPVLLTVLIGASWGCLLLASDRPAASRFMPDLPVDDRLPRILAERLVEDLSPTPLVDEWLSSDRPPLQAGVVLLLKPFEFHQGRTAYQTIGTLCQLMWLSSLVALASVIGLGARSTVVGILAASTSGFFLVNSLYVWPKLMAAALMITTTAVVIGMPGCGRLQTRPIAIVTGALLALSTLAHGGVWFSILALPALPAAWVALRRFGPAGIVLLVVAFGAVTAPWSAYKRFFDPPGNRLVKWHLAGVVPVDGRGTWKTLRDSYASKSIAGHLERWRVNLLISGHLPDTMKDESAASYARRAQFFNFTPAVGPVILGAISLLATALVRKISGNPFGPAGGLVLHSLATVLVWTGLMFIPSSSLVHQGSYVPVALLIFLGATAIGRWPMWARVPVLALHVLLFAWAWILTTPPPTGEPPASLDPWLLLGAATAFAVFASCLTATFARSPAEAPAGKG